MPVNLHYLTTKNRMNQYKQLICIGNNMISMQFSVNKHD